MINRDQIISFSSIINLKLERLVMPSGNLCMLVTISTIVFSPCAFAGSEDIVTRNIELDEKYLDGWLHAENTDNCGSSDSVINCSSIVSVNKNYSGSSNDNRINDTVNTMDSKEITTTK